MANNIVIKSKATGEVVREIPMELFAFRPGMDDHIKILAPIMVFLRPEYRAELIEAATQAPWSADKNKDNEIERLTAELGRLQKLLNTPEIVNFLKGVELEAAH